MELAKMIEGLPVISINGTINKDVTASYMIREERCRDLYLYA